MDPDACIIAMTEAYKSDDFDTFFELHADYSEWIGKGGHRATDDSVRQLVAATGQGGF
jgi:hypothetical protein